MVLLSNTESSCNAASVASARVVPVQEDILTISSLPWRVGLQRMSSQPAPVLQGSRLPWYGVRTKSNQERLAASVLEAKGFEHYLPSYQVRRRWSDRTVETTVPLFPGYLFCRFDSSQKLPVVSTPGVVSVVGFGNVPAPITDSEIEAIQAVLLSGIPAEPHSYLREGQKVRVTSGPLEGVEGLLIKKRSEWRMIVSITLLQRSIAVEIDRDCLEATT
ncbi:MAG: transcriptional activator RfaH [Bryobacterales bacterium]|nr:transcriptional activator RfaH [Bryobacterales bacterium]